MRPLPKSKPMASDNSLQRASWAFRSQRSPPRSASGTGRSAGASPSPAAAAAAQQREVRCGGRLLGGGGGLPVVPSKVRALGGGAGHGPHAGAGDAVVAQPKGLQPFVEQQTVC
mmetsp:Transcript_27566/g.45161  ORF Transcript_27566/g.45161 Transcript_27566/m.45161 type:complete len:114 (-) Transcript_27566:224-565(-)